MKHENKDTHFNCNLYAIYTITNHKKLSSCVDIGTSVESVFSRLIKENLKALFLLDD